MGSVFLSFALGCSHLPKNSILSAKRQFSACFSNCSNSLNFEAKINCNTIKTNVPKWRKTCTGLKFDWLNFYGPQSHILLLDHFEGPCTICINLTHTDLAWLAASLTECPPSFPSCHLADTLGLGAIASSIVCVTWPS